jgi:hypothetical protein
MSETNSFSIMHIKEGDKHDFNLRNVPYDIMLSLIGALKLDYTTRTTALCAPSFKQERAMQHQRHLEDCRKNGTMPQQQFIDFPL